MIPQRVHTIRGPNDGTGTSSDHESALMIAQWWHPQQHTSSDHTPLARMLPSVIGSIGSLRRLAAIPAIASRRAAVGDGGWWMAANFSMWIPLPGIRIIAACGISATVGGTNHL
jgi:hypothetical protein